MTASVTEEIAPTLSSQLDEWVTDVDHAPSALCTYSAVEAPKSPVSMACVTDA